MEIYVYSRSGLEAARPHEVPHVVISITSSPDDVARLRSNRNCVAVLRVSFPDVETASEQHPESTLFSREHAEAIWSFVREHRSGIERVIVHCDAGMSTTRTPRREVSPEQARVRDDARGEGIVSRRGQRQRARGTSPTWIQPRPTVDQPS